MTTPFKYPKSKHHRKLLPEDGRPYSVYKPYLQAEFENICVYCRMPDSLKGPDNFGVDHYKPKHLFPSLERVYTNLFYACNPCNRRKGKFWPSDADLKAGSFLPNPCDHVMFDHLKYQGARAAGKTHTGKFTIEALDLNDERSVEYRENIISLIALVKDKIRETERLERDLKQELVGAPQDERPSLKKDLSAVDQDKARLQKELQFLTGRVLIS